jgi:type VI secretion system protein ImpF
MSGSRSRDPRGDGRRSTGRAELPLLDRLIDDDPDQLRDPPLSAAEALDLLHRSVRRDLEALLNARRRWRSWPPGLRELTSSPIGFGIPDFASGAFNDKARREALRQEIEATIRRFEPRLSNVRATLLDRPDNIDPTLRLRIDALLRVDHAPEPVAFDTMIEATTSDVYVRERDV